MTDVLKRILEMFEKYTVVRDALDRAQDRIRELERDERNLEEEGTILKHKLNVLIGEVRDKKREYANLFQCARNVISCANMAGNDVAQKVLKALEEAVKQIQEEEAKRK